MFLSIFWSLYDEISFIGLPTVSISFHLCYREITHCLLSNSDHPHCLFCLSPTNFFFVQNNFKSFLCFDSLQSTTTSSTTTSRWKQNNPFRAKSFLSDKQINCTLRSNFANIIIVTVKVSNTKKSTSKYRKIHLVKIHWVWRNDYVSVNFDPF